MYRDIENIIQHDSQEYITSEGVEYLSNQKWTNCDIDDNLFCCSDCTKSLCLDIKKKILGKKRRETLFWLHGDGLNKLLTMNTMGKHKKTNEHKVQVQECPRSEERRVV